MGNISSIFNSNCKCECIFGRKKKQKQNNKSIPTCIITPLADDYTLNNYIDLSMSDLITQNGGLNHLNVERN